MSNPYTYTNGAGQRFDLPERQLEPDDCYERDVEDDDDYDLDDDPYYESPRERDLF